MKKIRIKGINYEIIHGSLGRKMVLVPMSNAAKARSWATQVLSEYGHDFTYLRRGQRCYALWENYTEQSWGYATCRKDESFDHTVGYAIATFRAMGLELPNYIFEN